MIVTSFAWRAVLGLVRAGAAGVELRGFEPLTLSLRTRSKG
jgi:hypothetical protein